MHVVYQQVHRALYKLLFNDTFKLIKDTLFVCVRRDRAIFIIKETKKVDEILRKLQNLRKTNFLSAADYFTCILN